MRLPFRIGDRVKIIPLEEAEARVISVFLAEDGWTVEVRYFHNGEPKIIKCFVDELKSDLQAAWSAIDQHAREIELLWRSSPPVVGRCDGLTGTGGRCANRHGRSVDGKVFCALHQHQCEPAKAKDAAPPVEDGAVAPEGSA